MSKQLRLLGCFLVFLVVSGSALFSFRVLVESGLDQAGYSDSGNVGLVVVDDQCRLWGMVSSSFPQSVVMDQLVNFPDSLKNLGGGPDGPGNVNGWGLLYFSSGAPVVARGQSMAYTDNAFNVAAQQLAASGNQVGMGHVRKSASGAKDIPDPHPFIRQRGGKTWALAHNGVLDIDNLKTLIGSTYLSYFVPAVGSNWNDPNVVDSDLYLIYVIKCIEESGWDVKMGIAEAETEIYRTDSSANANFLLSDGVEMWGYKESVDSIHPLCYKYDSVSGYSAIVSQPPEGPGLGSWISMSNFNLVEISVGTPPVLYQDIRGYGEASIAVNLQSPINGTVTMDNMPDFKFTVTHPSQLTFNCSLWLQNASFQNVYATKNDAVNGSLTTMTPSSPIPNGDWWWWINCTDGYASKISDKRRITINVFRGDKTFTSTIDGSTRTYWLDLPDDFDNSAPTPLVFFLHGYGGSRLSYSQKYPVLRQVFQNHTWIVAAVDCRTVSGYQNWYAESSRQDITDILNILKSDYYIDSSHVHIMGNSMGGSGALKYAMFNNQVIASLVDIHGVANFTQFYYETSDATYKASLEAAYGGTPSQVLSVYANESALGNEQRFTRTPVMIMHGTADATVSVSQSRNLNQSLSAVGYTVKYVEVSGVGHDAQTLISGREMEIFNWLDSHPLWASSVYLLLTADPAQGPYVRGHSVTFTVNVFNQMGPALNSSLTLTVTGSGNYGYFDVQPISVPAGTVGEFSFVWVVPDAAGTYVAEVGLAPPQLTSYDEAWLNVY
jgi:pimeloyl-ACP methyl ester carboxylesterase